jgi:hypothetical protein
MKAPGSFEGERDGGDGAAEDEDNCCLLMKKIHGGQDQSPDQGDGGA